MNLQILLDKINKNYQITYFYQHDIHFYNDITS